MSNYDHIHHSGDARQPQPLPQFIDFNTRIEEIGLDNLHQALAARILSGAALPRNEQHTLYEHHARFYTDLLADEQTSEAPLRAAFSAVRFATVTGRMLVDNNVTPPTPRPPEDVTPGDHWRTLHDEAKIYLIKNPNLRALTVHYRRYLDRSAKYYHVFSTVVGMSLKQLEQEQREQFVNLETALILGESNFQI